MDDLPGDHIRYLSLYLGFDHVIGSVAVDGSGLNNDARLTKGNEKGGVIPIKETTKVIKATLHNAFHNLKLQRSSCSTYSSMKLKEITVKMEFNLKQRKNEARH